MRTCAPTRPQLPDLIRAQNRTNETRAGQLDDLQGKVDEATAALAPGDLETQKLERQANEIATAAGRTPVRGPALRVTLEDAKLAALEKNAGTQKLKGEAVTVTLNDAPPNATAKLPGYPEPQPDYLVIHQQDLQAVVNALWQGGAQGIKVMDQRLISTSAVRCVGNTLILQGRVYSPPYKITAIGDPKRSSRSRSPPRRSRTTWCTSTSTGSAGKSRRTGR